MVLSAACRFRESCLLILILAWGLLWGDVLMAQIGGLPPFIRKQPVPVYAAEGEPVALEVTSAQPPHRLLFQWFKDGVPIAGAIRSRLDFSQVTSADGGVYSVQIKNNAGTIESQRVPVTVFSVSPHESLVANGDETVIRLNLDSLAVSEEPIKHPFLFDDEAFEDSPMGPVLLLLGLLPERFHIFSIRAEKDMDVVMVEALPSGEERFHVLPLRGGFGRIGLTPSEGSSWRVLGRGALGVTGPVEGVLSLSEFPFSLDWTHDGLALPGERRSMLRVDAGSKISEGAYSLKATFDNGVSVLSPLSEVFIDPSQRFEALTKVSDLGAWQSKVVWSDWDGDLDADLLLVGGAPVLQLKGYLHENGKAFEPSQLKGIHWDEPVSVLNAKSVDIDNDGDQDLFTEVKDGNDSTRVELFLNQGLSGFVRSQFQFPSQSEGAFLLRDLNLDGWLDVIVGRGDIYRNESGDGFRLDEAWSQELRPYELGFHSQLADLDEDMDVDVFVGMEVHSNTFAAVFLESLDGGEFRPVKIPLPISDLSFVESKMLDLDLDGDLDLFALNSAGTEVILINLGGFNFFAIPGERQGDLASMRLETAMSWGDVDHDGDLDLLLHDSDGLMSLLRNLGGRFELVSDRVFPIETKRALGSSWTDVDGNGTLDLALAFPPDLASRRLGGIYFQESITAPWLNLRIEGLGDEWTNRDGLGTSIRLVGHKADGEPFLTTRVLDSVGSRWPLHIGLPIGFHLDYLEIRWLSEGINRLKNGPIDSTLALLESRVEPRVQGASFRLGETLQIEAAFDGDSGVEIQWIRDGQEIAGAEDSLLVIEQAELEDFAEYRFVLTEGPLEVVSRSLSLSLPLIDPLPLPFQGDSFSASKWFVRDVTDDLVEDLIGVGRDSQIVFEVVNRSLERADSRFPIPVGTIAFSDVDNDGIVDYTVESEQRYRLVYGDRAGSLDRSFDIFEDLAGTGEGGLVSWIDFDSDGDLDFILDASLIYRNQGASGIDKQSERLIQEESRGPLAAIAWADINDDRYLDCLILSATGRPSLFLNESGTGLVAKPLPSDLSHLSGFRSVSWWDIDNDTDLDLLLSGTTVRLLENKGELNWEVSERLKDNLRGEHAIGDLDNDGFLDIVLCSDQGNFLFLQNDHGDLLEGVPLRLNELNLVTDVAPKLALRDISGDGGLDLLTFKKSDEGHLVEPRIWLNNGGANSWVQFDLTGVVSNRDGVGARVVAGALVNEEVLGTAARSRRGVASQDLDSTLIHIGLGSSSQIDALRVDWPSGLSDERRHIDVNQRLRLVERGGSLQPEFIESLVGDEVTFSLGGLGQTQQGLQWTFNDEAIEGATGRKLTILVDETSFGEYQVFVEEDETGGFLTWPARLALIGTPQVDFSTQLEPFYRRGDDVALRVEASGSTDLVFQWMRDGQPLLGQTDATLILPDIKSADSGAYAVVISNRAGAITHVLGELRLLPFQWMGASPLPEEPNDRFEGVFATGEFGGRESTLFGFMDGGKIVPLKVLPTADGGGTAISWQSDIKVAVDKGFHPSLILDFDENGKMDLVGIQDGAILRFEEDESGENTVARFVPDRIPGTGEWEGFDVADIDADGEFDWLFRSSQDLWLAASGSIPPQPRSIVAQDDSLEGEILMASFLDLDLDAAPEIVVLLQRSEGTDQSVREFYVFSPVGELRAKSPLSGDSDSAWIQAYTTSGDIDNDGDLDLFLWGDQAAGDTMQGHLIRNEGKGKLVASSSEPEGFWPVRISDAILLDFDNDSWLELLVIGEGGHVFEFEGANGIQLSRRVLTEIEDAALISTTDANFDGRWDLFILDGQGRLHHVTTNPGHDAWMGVLVSGRSSRNDGLGAALQLRPVDNGNIISIGRSLSGQNGKSGGQHAPLALMGLGRLESLGALQTFWPSGLSNEQMLTTPNRYVTAREPVGPVSFEPALLISPEAVDDGEFVFVVRGQPGTTYLIERSQDLRSWSPYSKLTLDTDEKGVFGIRMNQGRQQYFRVVGIQRQ